MPKTINPKSIVRYIKLGTGGEWEPECLTNGIIRLGFGTARVSRFTACCNGQWDKLRQSFLDDDYSEREASRSRNEVRHFFEDDGSTLWITFHGGRLHWCFLDPKFKPQKYSGKDDGVYRNVVGGWDSNDVNGNPLQQTYLSKKLTTLAQYKGTSCTPSAARYALQRINGETGAIPTTPKASDLPQPPPRYKSTAYRILRDTKLAKQVKALHNYKCQICKHTIKLPDGSSYAEAHHMRPLGNPHKGFDTKDNIVCVCPNHHAELDYGARTLSAEDLTLVAGHSINEEYVRYHNEIICGQGTK